MNQFENNEFRIPISGVNHENPFHSQNVRISPQN